MLEHAFGLNIKILLGPRKLLHLREKSKYLTQKKSDNFRKSGFQIQNSTIGMPLPKSAVTYGVYYGHNLTRILNFIFFIDKACKTLPDEC